MKCAIFEEHSSSCVVYSRFSGTLFPVPMIDGDHQTVICTANVEFLPIWLKPSSIKSGLACQWFGNDIYMQNVIKIYYVVKSYEHFLELQTDGRADELK